jgi:protein phosphatase
MNWEIGASLLSDTGCVRDVNEDCGRIVHPADDEERERRGVLALVADGMGGHSGGEVASRIAVETVHRVYYEAPGAPGVALAEALRAANLAIFERATLEPGLRGMGTTCVALAICGGEAYAANVGDSRLYLVREDRIYQMTADDSAVGAMVSQGLLTRNQARHHHDRNVILRALGTHEDVQVSTWEQPFPVRQGDRFVLCSDGLSDLVEDEELLDVVKASHEADACAGLVGLARSRGGFDNITVVAVRVGAPAQGPSLPATREFQVPS